MRVRGATAVVLLTALAAACSDALAPTDSGSVPLQLQIAGPQLVSQAELDALGDAFDRVDRYAVEVADSASGVLIVEDTITVAAGSSEHVLDVEVPEGTIGRTVRITLIAFDGTQELYRSVSYATVESGISSVRVSAEVRYTGPGIRGTVVDVQGAPAAGVTVQLAQDGSPIASIQTEDDGTWLFVGLTSGGYTVTPVPTGQLVYCPFFRDVTLATADDVVVTNFRESTDCTIRALVVSGGDFDETLTAARIIDTPADITAGTTFFYVNQLPSLAFLSDFDVVLLFMNGLFDESASLGDRVSEYVQAGGNVVIASFYWQGRSDAGTGSTGWGALEQIDPFTSTGGATYQPVVLGQILDDTHPIISGISSIDSNSYSSGVAAKPGASVIAEWSDGAPLVGYTIGPIGQRVVGVSLFPAAGQTVSGDVDALWQNAVRWAGEVGGPN